MTPRGQWTLVKHGEGKPGQCHKCGSPVLRTREWLTGYILVLDPENAEPADEHGARRMNPHRDYCPRRFDPPKKRSPKKSS